MFSLEMHVTHACNLACASCQHYTNQNHKGMTSVADAELWMSHWGHRLQPKHFELLGGEPTIHPELPAFVRLARRFFPTSHVRVLTNGFFLDRQPELPVALQEIGNSRLDISIHHGSWQYGALLGPNLQLAKEWNQKHGVHVNIKESYKTWNLQYQGSGAEMQPFEDQDPQASWDNCGCKHCFQLLDGNIWKCPPLAYLPMQNDKYGLSEKWQPYLTYRPLQAGCSDEEMRAFFQKGAEAVCGMCPAYPRPIDAPWPMPNPASGRPMPPTR
jgi:hypothetical protein